MEFINKYRIEPSTHLGRRFKSTKKLTEIEYPAYDAGGYNLFAIKMGVFMFVKGDLNKPFKISDGIKTFTSFEVIEHLQNPLVYLRSIHESLEPCGVLYLTTPVKWIFKGRYHFHDYSRDEITTILHMAGFRNLEITRIRAYDLRDFGLRPLIRKIRDVLFGQCFFIKAYK